MFFCIRKIRNARYFQKIQKTFSEFFFWVFLFFSIEKLSGMIAVNKLSIIVDKYQNHQIYNLLYCELYLNFKTYLCGKVYSRNLSPKLTILNNSIQFLLLKKRKIMLINE